MAASDFVAPLLTGEKKEGGPPGLLGTKSVHIAINMLFTTKMSREQPISKGEVCGENEEAEGLAPEKE